VTSLGRRREFWDEVATDLSEQMVRRVRENADRAGLLEIRWLARPLADFADLGSFDLGHAGGEPHNLEDSALVDLGAPVARVLLDPGHLLVRVSVAHRCARCGSPLPATYSASAEYRRLLAATGGLDPDAERHTSCVPSVVPKLAALFAGSPAALATAVRLEAALLSTFAARPLLRLYSRLSGRGCGEFVDRWFQCFCTAAPT